MATKMRILLGAVLSRHPYVAGSVWHRMQYVLGLRRLGHDVYYVEELAAGSCVDASGTSTTFERSINRAYFLSTMKRFGLTGKACQIYNGGDATTGLSMSELEGVAKHADILLNMSGHVTADCVLSNVGLRVYIDQDPVYTQLWAAEYGAELNFASHDLFFSVGLNIGTPHSAIPDCGLEWHPTLPPVALDCWDLTVDTSARRFTTVASWTGYGDLYYRGEWYRSKYDEFKRFTELPQRVDQEIEVALKAYREDDEDVRALRDRGWIVTNASTLGDLSSYQRYLSRSRAAIDIAKNAYVKGRSGWLGDRASHYLASGKPVLAQSTGYEHLLPTGRGLVTFNDLEEAVEGIEEINRDYVAHCRAARAFAEEHLAAEKVLARLLATCQEKSR